MATSTPAYRPGTDLTAHATAAVTGRRFVKITTGLDAANGTTVGVAPAAAAGPAFGVAAHDAPNGGLVAVIRRGNVTAVDAAEAITAGADVEVGADGKAKTHANGRVVGTALSAAKANETVFVDLHA